MLIVNTRRASTMVIGVNHVNLSTNLKNPVANTNAGFYAPCLSKMPRVTSGFPIHRANALVNSSSHGALVH